MCNDVSELSSINSASDNLLEENRSLKEAVKSVRKMTENDRNISAHSKTKQNKIKIKFLTNEVCDLKGKINSLKADNHNLTQIKNYQLLQLSALKMN